MPVPPAVGVDAPAAAAPLPPPVPRREGMRLGVAAAAAAAAVAAAHALGAHKPPSEPRADAALAARDMPPPLAPATPAADSGVEPGVVGRAGMPRRVGVVGRAEACLGVCSCRAAGGRQPGEGAAPAAALPIRRGRS